MYILGTFIDDMTKRKLFKKNRLLRRTTQGSIRRDFIKNKLHKII